MQEYDVLESVEIGGEQRVQGDTVSLDAEAEETKSLLEAGKIKAKEADEDADGGSDEEEVA